MRVQHPGGVEHHLRKRHQAEGQHQAADVHAAHQFQQGGKRIDARQSKWRARTRRQRFGHEEIAVDEIGRRQARCHVKRQVQIDLAQQASQHGSANEAQAKGRADLAEALGAVVVRGNVGGIGGRDRHAGRRDAADDAPDEQAGQVGRPARGEKIDAHAGHRVQQHGTASHAVADGAQHGHEDELQQAEDGCHDAVPECLRFLADDKVADQDGQHWHHQADAQHVDEDADEDEIEVAGALYGGGRGMAVVAGFIGHACFRRVGKAPARDRFLPTRGAIAEACIIDSMLAAGYRHQAYALIPHSSAKAARKSVSTARRCSASARPAAVCILPGSLSSLVTIWSSA